MIPRGREPEPHLGASADALPMPRASERNNMDSRPHCWMTSAISWVWLATAGEWHAGRTGVQFSEPWEGPTKA